MNVNLKTALNNNYSKPAFTAQLKGSAVRKAISDINYEFQLEEYTEIMQNVKLFGDSKTIIDCASDGTVLVSNKKFGDFVNKFHLPVNKMSAYPFLDLLKNFNTEARILNCEYKLLDRVFCQAKNLEQKQAKFKLFNTDDVNYMTRFVLNKVAKEHGVLPEPKSNPNINLEILKAKALRDLNDTN